MIYIKNPRNTLATIVSIRESETKFCTIYFSDFFATIISHA